MKKRLNADTMNVKRKTVTVGIDVHKVSCHLTAQVEGVVVESVTIKLSYRVLKKLLAHAYRQPPAPYENGRVQLDCNKKILNFTEPMRRQRSDEVASELLLL